MFMKMKLKKLINQITCQKGQALVEMALAIPILILLFCGCMQLVHIGIAHIVVRDAAFEAGRSAVMNQNNLSRGEAIAQQICRKVSSGATTFEMASLGGNSHEYVVTHYLHPIFPVINNIEVKHSCPDFLFDTGAREE